MNSVCPGPLSTDTRPWCASTTAATMASPRPVLAPFSLPGGPDPAGVGAGEPLEHLSRISGGMPGPLSVTVITAWSPSTATPVSTRVPAGVWVRALASRLATTWCSRCRSPSATTGSSGSASCQAWSGPAARASLTALITISVRSVGRDVEVRPGVQPGQQQQVLDQA